jgi:hypothetical protein
VITLGEYYMGRESAYSEDFTLEIARNAANLLAAVNTLLKCAEDDGVTAMGVASGWRPRRVNDLTSHAAARSAHLTGQAVDLRDHADRQLARWCLRNLDMLEKLALWMEDPRFTPTWTHLQSIAPGSGKRVFIPSNGPALALALPEQNVG